MLLTAFGFVTKVVNPRPAIRLGVPYNPTLESWCVRVRHLIVLANVSVIVFIKCVLWNNNHIIFCSVNSQHVRYTLCQYSTQNKNIHYVRNKRTRPHTSISARSHYALYRQYTDNILYTTDNSLRQESHSFMVFWPADISKYILCVFNYGIRQKYNCTLRKTLFFPGT